MTEGASPADIGSINKTGGYITDYLMKEGIPLEGDCTGYQQGDGACKTLHSRKTGLKGQIEISRLPDRLWQYTAGSVDTMIAAGMVGALAH